MTAEQQLVWKNTKSKTVRYRGNRIKFRVYLKLVAAQLTKDSRGVWKLVNHHHNLKIAYCVAGREGVNAYINSCYGVNKRITLKQWFKEHWQNLKSKFYVFNW